MIDEASKGWMAGILDFQAHICDKSNKTRNTPQLTMYVETKIFGIIRRLCDMTGISFREHGSGFRGEEREWMRRGCGEHCPEAHVMGCWEITGASMSVVLWNLRSYMITTEEPSREPWDWAMGMAIAGARLTGRGSPLVLDGLRRLSGLGWDMPPVFQGAVPEQKAISA
jgi:hypothetical protein